MLAEENKENTPNDPVTKKTFVDHFSIAFATFGVGYLPLAPGTWGSAVAIGIFLLVRWAYVSGIECLGECQHWSKAVSEAWLGFVLLVVFLLFTLLGIWAAGRAAKLFGDKDPGKVVVDELMGQFLVFFFVPLGISWWMILLGFLLFRFFDIWKPYPIDDLQDLPGGLGVCADDILAGAYAGICLNLIYAVSLSL
jgi:phosphatidylglycerophosphatase A